MADFFGCAIDETAPKVEVRETASELVITAELRGLDRRDIKIEMTGRFLTIQAKRTTKPNESAESFYNLERGSGTLHRSFPIEFAATPGRFSASLQDGILTVIVPKLSSKNAMRIPIQTN